MQTHKSVSDLASLKVKTNRYTTFSFPHHFDIHFEYWKRFHQPNYASGHFITESPSLWVFLSIPFVAYYHEQMSQSTDILWLRRGTLISFKFDLIMYESPKYSLFMFVNKNLPSSRPHFCHLFIVLMRKKQHKRRETSSISFDRFSWSSIWFYFHMNSIDVDIRKS